VELLLLAPVIHQRIEVVFAGEKPLEEVYAFLLFGYFLHGILAKA
jgi:hypothetical protein